MDTFIEEEFEDWSLGFPVLFRNVPMARVRGDVAPRINSHDFQHAVLWLLANRPAPLSGRQVRFARRWMQKTLADFAALCGMTSYQSVMKWEAKEHEPTGMHKSTEILLRCRILEALPDEVWERFEAEEGGRLGFVHRLEGVSNFERDAEPTMIELDADPYMRADYEGARPGL
jgi:DNA-binding transcriptional regulator YiaG